MPYSDPVKQKEAQHQSYLRNRELIRLRTKNKTDVKRTYLRKVKDVPCMDCEIKYPYYVMHFDHREGVEKIEQISTLVHKAAWDIILKEIAKCDVVCANCHAIRTWNRKQRFTPLAIV